MTRFSILALASLAGTLHSCPVFATAPNALALATAILADESAVRPQGRPLAHAPRRWKAVSARPSGAMDRVAAVSRDWLVEPDSETSLGAVQIYPWSEGSIYRLYAAPERISDIELQPGEALVSVAAGDTARWIIGDTSSGSGPARRTHVLVKPAAAGLRTNILIATDRRIYHIQAASSAALAMAAISWTYPQDSLIALASKAAEAEPAVAPAVAVESLNFGYRIEGGDVDWRPLRAFDDGHQTFIEFPPTLADGQAPPLFVTGADGKAELVNYRVKGHYYVVDRLFSAAELRLGGKHQQVVRIVRDYGAKRSRRPE